MSTIDVTKLVRDVQESTMQQAFYLQSKAFFEKNNEHINEIARLKAEVERLTKAGNAFSYAMDSLAVFANEEARLMARTASLAFKDALNAAKEGKPRA